MSVQKDRDRLLQAKTLAELQRNPSLSQMIRVHTLSSGDLSNQITHCCLVRSVDIEKVLTTPSWDLGYGEGVPSDITHFEGGKKKRVEYFRYGNEEGIEPLIITRGFHKLRDDYIEISEEFRL